MTLCLLLNVEQKKGVDAANMFIKEGILEKLDVDQLIASPTSPKAFTIVDMGCAVGANTLAAVENVIDSVNLKLQSRGLEHLSETLEFQVFFNDLITNDFNTLFRCKGHISFLLLAYSWVNSIIFYSSVFLSNFNFFFESSFQRIFFLIFTTLL